MLKRTLYFGSPAYLSLRSAQLVINLPNAQGLDNLSGQNTVPVEDIALVVLDNQQLTISHALLTALLEQNAAVVQCNATHHPVGLLLPLDGHDTQAERFRIQVEASAPLRKQLWQQTVQAKILNQAALLKQRKQIPDPLVRWAEQVKSGDPTNVEARAAVYYWPLVFPIAPAFRRNRDGEPPNNLLNYGYAILRAIAARALVGSGLLPTFGIHHTNRYNAYALADDVMEPYRPYVDALVCQIVKDTADYTVLTRELKARLLGIASTDVVIKDERSPLLVAMSRTTASLYRCLEGSQRKILFPEL